MVGDEEIKEIHVLSKPSKSPKLLARDIETLLQARFSLDIDHKKISIVAFDLEEEKKRELVASCALGVELEEKSPDFPRWKWR